jgi:hypothetical protein
MATKRIELESGVLTRVAEDEPVFILRAKDKHAADVVRLWAKKAELSGTPRAKVDEALDLAHEMDRWAKVNGGARVPD